MIISVNSNWMLSKYGREDFTIGPKKIREAGFDAVDFSFSDMSRRENFAFNGDNYIELAENLRKEYDKMGLSVNQAHAPYAFKDWDNKENFDNYIYPMHIRSMEIAAILGAKTIIIHPLHFKEYHHHEEEIFEMNMKFYRSLLPYCREYGIKVGIENMWQKDPRRKCIIPDTCSTKEEFVRYIDTLDSEYMVACLDVGHAGLPWQDDEAHDFVRYLGRDRLKALHIHDNDYITDQHLLPYMGKVNWNEFFKALGEIDYTGDFTYEVKGECLTMTDDVSEKLLLKFAYDMAKNFVDVIEKNRPSK